VILGCAGAGKTTFARRLSKRLAAPVICLDAIWRSGSVSADLSKFRAIIAEEHWRETWVSDGNFAQATFDLRLPHADLIIWLERPRMLCAWWAMIRVIKRDEIHRLRDVAKVLRFIWGFDHVNRPLIEAQRLVHGPHVPVLHLNAKTETEHFLLAVH
jgi:adenylate kinase family enzyme